MPTYVYRRFNPETNEPYGKPFEVVQSILAPALEVHPKDGAPIMRIMQPPNGYIFKGTGFYQTDYMGHARDAGS